MITEEDLSPGGKRITDYASYEDMLISQITPQDMIYLEDVNVAAKIVELGYRGPKREGYNKDRFTQVKAHLQAKKIAERNNQTTVLSAGKNYEKSDAILRAMQQREEANRTGKQSSIFFIRDRNEHGDEVSAYIDFSHRLVTEDFEPVFNEKKKFEPKSTDLSFFNWNTTRLHCRNSPNYEVIAKSVGGMVFRNLRDNKIVNVDPTIGTPGDNSSRTVVPTTDYISVVIYDHYNRRKT